LEVITVAETNKRAQQVALGAERAAHERELAFLERDAKRLGSRLFTALSLDPSLLPVTSLAANTAQTGAIALLADVEFKLAYDDADNSEIDKSRLRLEVVVRELAVLQEREQHSLNMQAVQEQHARTLRGEHTALDARSLRAALGELCPVCKVPIDHALAHGCGLSRVLPDLSEIAALRDATAAELDACLRAIEGYGRELRDLQRARRPLEVEEAELRAAIQSADEEARRRRISGRQAWRDASKLVDEAERLVELYDEHQNATSSLAAVVQGEEKLKDEIQAIQAHRTRHASVIARLRELFGYVCHAVLGTETECRLELAGQTLRADVQVGGMAMESLKAIVFDVAALLLSIEGKGVLPAFLVHDSPREADLGLSLYHKLFRFMARLESIGEPPPFQYIITTTTEPPAELGVAPFVVATLSGDDDANRLFRRSL
jgi:hypothetical protein